MSFRTLTAVIALAASVAGVVGLAASPGIATGSTGTYVSLGDSYTSASGVMPMAPGAPVDCSQSAINYPHLVAQATGLVLDDVSCGGATVQNMSSAQFPDAPPQFDALTPTTSVVTLGIGGNDNGLFASAIAACGGIDFYNALDFGAPCKSAMGSYFDNQIESDAANIAAALQRIHQLSPSAKVFVVGYPDILPQRGSCYPTIPITSGDVAYLDGIERHLNSMLATQAARNGATYVDLYTRSVGHDACKPVGTRWVEPVVPSSPNNIAPIHPNALGAADAAIAVRGAFATAGIG